MLSFDREGLIPAVIQDETTNEVLMVAFMNQAAFDLTRETGYTHFYSRSRNALWRKGEQSGHTQEVRAIYVNCEENSLLIRVTQHGGAACHTGYRSCYYRRLLPDGSYETIAGRVFDPDEVYNQTAQLSSQLEKAMRQLYSVYIYLRDHDMSEESNTSRLLQEHSPAYLTARLADELQELADVQSGEHAHSDPRSDTTLEGSQVGYWLLLLAATQKLQYQEFQPHRAILQGYVEHVSAEQSIELRQGCLNLLTTYDPISVIQGLEIGFQLIGWACAEAGISPLAPAEFDLEQMKRKGLV
jgi:phosphoribosyl-AMP cyclohydrolase